MATAMATEMATAAASGKAVLIGATGAIGNCLLCALLRDKEHFSEVVVFGRRKATVPDGCGVTTDEEEQKGRLVQHIEDFDDIPESRIKELCAGGSVFFNCMGSTRKAAGSAQAFYHIDYELSMKFATAAKAAEIPHFSLVSSMGASPTSWIHYTKTKGQLEEAIKGLKFKCVTILRPGLLDRGQGKRRFGEKLAMVILSPMPVANVAEAMIYNANMVFSSDTPTPLTVADNNLIHQWASKGTNQASKQEAGAEAAAANQGLTSGEPKTEKPAETGEKGDANAGKTVASSVKKEKEEVTSGEAVEEKGETTATPNKEEKEGESTDNEPPPPVEAEGGKSEAAAAEPEEDKATSNGIEEGEKEKAALDTKHESESAKNKDNKETNNVQQQNE